MTSVITFLLNNLVGALITFFVLYSIFGIIKLAKEVHHE